MVMLKTKVDEMLELLAPKKKMLMGDIAHAMKWDIRKVEKICQALEKERVVTLNYPVFGRAAVRLIVVPQDDPEIVPEGKEIEKYLIKGYGENAIADLRVMYSEIKKERQYFLIIPRVSKATWIYFRSIENEVIKLSPLKEMKEEEKAKELEEKRAIIAGIMKVDLSPEQNDLDGMAGILLRDMYGLGELEILLLDFLLEEIIINGSRNPVAVYHRKYGWLKTNIVIASEAEVENYASQIARKVGKQISLLNPLLDARLLTGDRVNATLFPVSTNGNTITLRMFARNPWTIISLMSGDKRTMDVNVAAMLWQAVHYELNVMVGGGTASGKTSLLNSIVALMPPNQRIVTIEDTRELVLPQYQWNWVPLTTRPPNPEGLGEITMLDLIINSLRMRPDRIVMGEIRRKKEAEVLFEAMHTGHSVYGTMHADTGSQLLKRLIEPPIEVPKSEVEDVHLVAIQYRDRRRNVRRILEIGEVSSGAAGEPKITRILGWRPRSDNFEMINKPVRYLEQLNLHTGMTEKEIGEDQDDKVSILNWMAKNNLSAVDDIGRVMYRYYTSAEDLVKGVKKGEAPSKLL